MVLSRNREHFRTIWSKPPRTSVSIRKITVFVHKDELVVVHTTNEKADSKNFFLITDQKLDECLKDEQFTYTPGIISKPVSRLVFLKYTKHREAHPTRQGEELEKLPDSYILLRRIYLPNKS